MKPETERSILALLQKQGGYARASALWEAGAHPPQLADVQRAVPGAVFCLGTALSIHGIGTWEPPEIQLALRRDRRIKLPDFPPCRVFYFSGARLELGVEERSGSSGPVIVYDREKTICDVLRFRSAIGP
ncbi:MAG: hypothetical protein WCL50_17665, partial [Spirochaetota bacterium]